MPDKEIIQLPVEGSPVLTQVIPVQDAIGGAGSTKQAEILKILELAGSIVAGGGVNVAKPTTDAPDDNFDTGTLNGKWSVTSGGSGTVDLLSTSTTGIYDLTTRSGQLLFQIDSTQEVLIKQNFTLPDNTSILLSCSGTLFNDDIVINNEIQLGFSLNNSDVTWADNDSMLVAVDTTSSTQNSVIAADGNSLYGGSSLGVVHAQQTYLRIARTGLTYTAFYSLDGVMWSGIGQVTTGSEYTRLWLGCASAGGTFAIKPICAINWVRQGSNNLDPW